MHFRLPPAALAQAAALAPSRAPRAP
jgi:hypothetical protein